VSEFEMVKYISENVAELFPGFRVAGVEESLTGGHRVDLHLRDADGDDVVIEVKRGRLGRGEVGRLISYLSLLENIYPPLKNVRLVVVAESIGEGEKRILDDLKIRFVSYGELGVTKEKVGDYFREKLLNVPTGVEAALIGDVSGRGCTIIDAQYVEESLGLSRDYANKLLERLEGKRYLERIARGKYIYIPVEYGYEERFPPMNPLVVGEALDGPYYFGYFTANTINGLTTQHSPKVYVCTRKPRRTFSWRGTRYVFVSLVERKFFGYVNKNVEGCWVHVADPEKAVIDSVDKPEYTGGVSHVVAVLLKAITGGIDLDKLVGYAERLGSNAATQRLGYLTEVLERNGFIDLEVDFIKKIKSLVPEGASYSYLGARNMHGCGGETDRRWRLNVNVPREKLLGEVEVR
jgi:predicted transcriptional regulator of viral defense system